MEITKKHRQILLKKLKTQRGEFCEECGSIKDLVVYFKDKDEDNFKNNNTFLLCEVCKKAKETINKAKKDSLDSLKTPIKEFVACVIHTNRVKLDNDEEFLANGDKKGVAYKKEGRIFLRTR